MKIKHKHIKIIDIILVVLTLGIILITFVYYNDSEPIALSPENGHNSRNRFVLFEFENAQEILIDDNVEFSSPEKFEVKNNFVINLKPGRYYWKLIGNGESEIRQFSVESEVSLEVRESEDEGGKYNVINVGTEGLDVEVYEFGKLKENVILDVYSEKEVYGEKFVGGKDD